MITDSCHILMQEENHSHKAMLPGSIKEHKG